MSAIANGGTAVELVGLAKRFGATIAVADASLECRAGEVHALLGENGAGKSTLMKILSGMYQPDAGELLVDGERVHIRSARDAFGLGIATAYQELTIEGNLTVAENLLVSREPTACGLISFRGMAREAKRILQEWGIDDLDPRTPADRLPLGDRQRLEIVRALQRGTRLLIMDEPSSALAADEVRWLFTQLARARERGTGVIYISHRMGEVNEICDRATVLRNGRTVSTFDVGTVSDAEVVELMLGHTVAERVGRLSDVVSTPGPTVVQTEALTVAPDLHDASFELHAGEILGVAGLQGHGQHALFMTLFGAQPRDGGRILLEGKPAALRSPRAAIRAGIGLVPEDRQAEGLLPGMSISANVSLPTLGPLSRGGITRPKRERRAVRAVLDPLNLSTKGLDADVSDLSGGNQQKLVLAKWLLAESRVLLMYDATRGVDVGTKAEMYTLMRAFVQEGGAVLFYSTDVEELAVNADRVLVLYRGRVTATLEGDAIGEDRILAEMIGGESDARAA